MLRKHVDGRTDVCDRLARQIDIADIATAETKLILRQTEELPCTRRVDTQEEAVFLSNVRLKRLVCCQHGSARALPGALQDLQLVRGSGNQQRGDRG